MIDKKPVSNTSGDGAAKPPPKAQESRAVLLATHEGVMPGTIVRGAAAVISELVKSKKARPATDRDLGIAAGRTVRIK